MSEDTKEKIVYRISDRNTGETLGSGGTTYRIEYDFHSPNDARQLCDNKFVCKVSKYRVTYELIDDDVDGKDLDEIEAHKVKHEKDQYATYEAKMNKKLKSYMDTYFSGTLLTEAQGILKMDDGNLVTIELSHEISCKDSWAVKSAVSPEFWWNALKSKSEAKAWATSHGLIPVSQ